MRRRKGGLSGISPPELVHTGGRSDETQAISKKFERKCEKRALVSPVSLSDCAYLLVNDRDDRPDNEQNDLTG